MKAVKNPGWHTTTLPEILGVSDAREDDLYAAMDWVLKRQEVIEKKLAARHLHNDGLALYDLTSELPLLGSPIVGTDYESWVWRLAVC